MEFNEAYQNKCNYSIVMKKIMKYRIIAFFGKGIVRSVHTTLPNKNKPINYVTFLNDYNCRKSLGTSKQVHINRKIMIQVAGLAAKTIATERQIEI